MNAPAMYHAAITTEMRDTNLNGLKRNKLTKSNRGFSNLPKKCQNNALFQNNFIKFPNSAKLLHQFWSYCFVIKKNAALTNSKSKRIIPIF